MNVPVEVPRSPAWPRVAALALIAVGAAGCSADTSRFSESPLHNPYGSGRGEVTGSVPAAQPAPVARVDARPLPQAAAPLPPPTAPATTTAQTGVSGGSRGLASYEPPRASAAPASGEAMGSSARQSVRPGWDWNGGTAITVARGETVDTISQKYGVPPAAILQANGMTHAAAVKPGQRLVIPHHGRSAALAPRQPMPAAAAPAAIPAKPAPAAQKPAAAAGQQVHIVAPGETLITISKRYGKSLVEMASANRIAPHTRVNLGDRLVIPGGSVAVTPAPAPTSVAAAGRPAAAPQKVVAAEPAVSARVITPATEPAPAAAETPVKAAEPVGSMAGFRWPARGRVIAGFGSKPNGQQNDGINISLPEGTPVKSAEDGVVAYAGSELKGYGNLVLVRHSNGYVTAYAHASEIAVKRGDTVKRGQVIAKSGQSGNVTAPQLHFEIRKGSSPIDPLPFLDKGG